MRFIPFSATTSLFVVVLAFIALPAFAQEFIARVDRTRVSQNETLTLEVIYAERADTDSIDFAAQLPDFSILSIRPSTQTRWVNGRRSSQTSWQVTLVPKRTGRLRIPAFSLQKARTRPIEIRVDTPPDGPEEGAPLSAELKLDRDRAFVGEQILATISLSAQRDIGELRGSPLEIPGAQTTLINQREFKRTFGGTPYQVTELVYAIFPNQAGRLDFGAYEYQGTRRRIQRVVARTEPRSIEILDPASDPDASQRSPWFAASGVAIASEWSRDRRDVRVGEPITRTLRITAAGQRAAAIAPLSLREGAFKQYKEQPDLSDAETSTGILGTRTEAIVLVPTAAGELRLPPIEIDWWNIETRRWETARIPAETLEVLSPLPGTAGVDEEPVFQESDPPASAPALRRDSPGGAWLTTTLAGVSVVLGIACLALWRRVRELEAAREEAPRHDPHHGPPPGEAHAYAKLIDAISRKEPESIRSALLTWGRSRWPDEPVASLEQFAALADGTQAGAGATLLRALDGKLYGRESSAADGGFDYRALEDWIDAVRAAPVTREQTIPQALPDLYPH